jgi:hypothetical protein
MEVGIKFRGMQKNTLQRMGQFQSQIPSRQDALDTALNLTSFAFPIFSYNGASALGALTKAPLLNDVRIFRTRRLRYTKI